MLWSGVGAGSVERWAGPCSGRALWPGPVTQHNQAQVTEGGEH